MRSRPFGAHGGGGEYVLPASTAIGVQGIKLRQILLLHGRIFAAIGEYLPEVNEG